MDASQPSLRTSLNLAQDYNRAQMADLLRYSTITPSRQPQTYTDIHTIAITLNLPHKDVIDLLLVNELEIDIEKVTENDYSGTRDNQM